MACDFLNQSITHLSDKSQSSNLSQSSMLSQVNYYRYVPKVHCIRRISFNLHYPHIEHLSSREMAAAEHDRSIAKILPLCNLSVGPGVRDDECTICRRKIESNQLTVIHKACRNTWCSACISDWAKQQDSDDQRPRCPMCQANISIIEKDYANTNFAALRLQARLARPAPQELRVFENK